MLKYRRRKGEKKGDRDQGYASAVVCTGMAFRATLSLGASVKGFILKKNLRSFSVFATTYLSFRSFSFLTYTMKVCCIIQERKKRENQNRHHIQTFLRVQITSTFGDYTKEGKRKCDGKTICLALENECIGRQSRFTEWGWDGGR